MCVQVGSIFTSTLCCQATYWVGQFSPAVANVSDVRMGPNPCPDVWDGKTPFTEPAPVKWIEGNPVKSGWHDFVVTNGRESVNWVLFKGQLTNATAVAVSRAAIFATATAPMHVRLARTHSTNEMRVSWTSKSNQNQSVRWGRSPGVLSSHTRAVASTYTAADLCGPPANQSGWHAPGFFHEAVLQLPAPSLSENKYFYSVGNDLVGWSPTRSFVAPTPPSPHSSLAILVLADMGVAYEDGTSYHLADPTAFNTSVHAARCTPRTPRSHAHHAHHSHYSYMHTTRDTHTQLT